MATLQPLLLAVYSAEDAYHEALAVKLKPGIPVTVLTGDLKTQATVLRVCRGRVQILSHTGKQYWVNATRLAEHDVL